MAKYEVILQVAYGIDWTKPILIKKAASFYLTRTQVVETNELS